MAVTPHRAQTVADRFGRPKKEAAGGAGGQVREDPLIVRPGSTGGDEGFALTG